jgi:hypothetical protein
MLFHRRRQTKIMKKLWSLALVSAALSFALPTAASAHDFHGHGWHGYRSHFHGPAFFPPIPIPIPVPVPAYAPVYAPAYAAPCPPPAAYYPPAYYRAPAYYAPAAPFIAVRTPHVAVSIGGFFPY